MTKHLTQMAKSKEEEAKARANATRLLCFLDNIFPEPRNPHLKGEAVAPTIASRGARTISFSTQRRLSPTRASESLLATVMFARDWSVKLPQTIGQAATTITTWDEGKAPTLKDSPGFRTTWVSGWWLEQQEMLDH